MSATNPGFGPLTLRDLQNAHGVGTIERTVLDAISKRNALMDDISFSMASDGDRDITEVITGLPKAQFYALGEGKLPSAGSRQTKSFAPARAYVMLSIERDKFRHLAEKGREQKYLNDEIDLQVGALGTLLVESFLYGDRAKNAKGINGLAKYYNKLGEGSGNDLDPAKRVFNGCTATQATASRTDNRSIFCVAWGDKAVKPFYPEGAKDGGLNFGGSKMDDVPRTDSVNGGTVHYLEREFTWNCGLSLVDPRKCSRIANIKKGALLTDQAYSTHLLEKLMLAIDFCDTAQGEKKVLYMAKEVWTYIKVLMSRLTSSNAITYANLMDRPTEFLFGVPVRTNESQDIDEDEVTA